MYVRSEQLILVVRSTWGRNSKTRRQLEKTKSRWGGEAWQVQSPDGKEGSGGSGVEWRVNCPGGGCGLVHCAKKRDGEWMNLAEGQVGKVKVVLIGFSGRTGDAPARGTEMRMMMAPALPCPGPGPCIASAFTRLPSSALPLPDQAKYSVPASMPR